jgi:hypothetical protein
MNPSHHGSDEQMFGAKQQIPHEARNDEEVGGATGGAERKTG